LSVVTLAPKTLLRARPLSLCCGIMALALGLLSFTFGWSNGFQNWMPAPIEIENVKIAAALSDLVYGEKKGYIADVRVYDVLHRNGFTLLPDLLKPLGEKLPHNLSNAALLNQGLARAARLGPLPDPKVIIQEQRPVEVSDLGSIDFYKMAFSLFGFAVQSFYKFYYLIYFASVLLFVIAYWRRLEAMALLVVFVGLHLFAQAWLADLDRSIDYQGVGTPYTQAFASVLGMLAALHIALATWRPPRASVAAVAALLGQAAILCFVSTVRASALWEVLWPLTIAAGFLALAAVHYFDLPGRIRLLRRLPASEPPVEWLRLGLSWPAMALVAAFVLTGAIQNARMNPIYRFSDEFLPTHMFWHSVFVGLSLHPQWEKRYGSKLPFEPAQIHNGDALPMVAAAKWLDDDYGIAKSYLISPIFGMKYRTTERIIREVYLDFIKHHLRFALQLHLIYKPKVLIDDFVTWNLTAWRAWPAWGLIPLALTLGLLGGAAVVMGRTMAETRFLVAIPLVGGSWTIATAIVIFSSYGNMSDQALILDATIIGGLLAAIAFSARRISARQQGLAPETAS